ncbi:GNAT family N-acetyltransferase [Acaryochloris sp. CCMEE 5410]|uniref:GNAT family N-acetyltransferase n=1 Tax=Acaryochloris sp. CCMEE 5410 TaxID=310037 RepID=UPI0002484EDF|nr:GNAT family N-acetyltransferase [Acaryochloris sp. CCMEE 5410]KAI9129515.1 GNAT family N-acetyltransferase [Acaryochloris sp. CCMEE 5410]
MKSEPIVMSWEEYELMPWRLGWKHEYFNGMAYLTPRQQSVLTVIEVAPRNDTPQSFKIRPVVSTDVLELKHLFFEIFHDSVEYCNYEERDIQESAQSCIDNYFAAVKGEPSKVSCVAISPEGELIGIALIIEQPERYPYLRLLGVSPSWQRRGVATSLMATILNQLVSTPFTQLESRYFLANEASRNWHHRFGFQDQLDLFVARLFYRHAQHELWRQEKLGQLPEKDLSRLASEVEQWQAEVDRQEVAFEATYTRELS